MLSAKNVKYFEKELLRLYHVGSAGNWIALVDAESRITLLCELIAADALEYMKQTRGWDIEERIGRKPQRTLLLVIDGKTNTLLHVFEKGQKFSVSQIDEMHKFYEISEDLNLRGGKLLFKRWGSWNGLIYFAVIVGIGAILSKCLL